jgi:2-polyprenyl-3-methyl-5-hydroxy-6-metoxy-1,4-benzoquinol methylase
MESTLTEEQGIQEHEYSFPYHYIPEIKPFSQSRNLWWGYEYASYIQYLVQKCKALKFSSLIDVGCGDGRLLAELGSAETGELYGTDFSQRALSFARAFCPERVHLSTVLPTEKKFDAFTAIEVFEHIPPRLADSFLESIKTVLEPGARGIITIPTTNVPLNPKHYRHFTAESITLALEKHFTIESIEFLNAVTFRTKLMQRLLANRFFILNMQSLKESLYTWYKTTSLKATPQTAKRLLVNVTNP